MGQVKNQKLRMEHDIKLPLHSVYTVMQELDHEGLNRRKPIVKKNPKKVILPLKKLIVPIL